ncbi:OB-fold nucleic acid binding domain-containing protein [Dyadobacter sp. CY261]|uniref:OB-fold nucleic acid binding domain-containing protein n=1 Tax=Dyadobacter sp. CY261 TaxID=2907203 RepID=UPI00286DBF31|nr:OB-fold nucleic acid binding domain-containing protein [Dyadobacter sp. CY261]
MGTRPAKTWSAKGICFITVEDETGIANLVAFKNTFAKFRKEVLRSRLLMVEGKLQIEGVVIHVIAKNLYDCLICYVA